MAENDAGFDRDLGYLEKFLTGLATHAEGLAEPARSRLTTLVAEEVVRWREIGGLLRGEAVDGEEAAEVQVGEEESTRPGADEASTVESEAPDDTQTSIPAAGGRPVSAPPASRAAPPPSRRASFTVGSLLDAPKKR